jgi:molybdate transport system regulatory protein
MTADDPPDTTQMSRASLHVHVRVMMEDVGALGPGKADLLERIDRTGSISAAAKSMGMSYRRAWLLVDQMNACFAAPLVAATAGGVGGGGAGLSPEGRGMLALYRMLQSDLTDIAARHEAHFSARMRQGARP